MKNLPLIIENKIFFYLSHPISNILRNKIVMLRGLDSCPEYPINYYVNFTNYVERGFLDLRFLFCFNIELYAKLYENKI